MRSGGKALVDQLAVHGVELAFCLPSAFERAVESGRPAVVVLGVDPEAISPRWTISELREGAA
jgi:thiamine pyrophosphate-dependent acetolactate synthase large subunit-like protein